MEDGIINTSFELLNRDWSFFDNFMGLRDSEAKKFKEFIQTSWHLNLINIKCF